MNNKNKRLENRFKYLKKLINDKNDIKERIDMFYFNKKAINFANKLFIDYYMMNNYYTLQVIDILLMTDEAKNVYEVQNKLFKDYESDYASSIWSNYIECMSKEVSTNV